MPEVDWNLPAEEISVAAPVSLTVFRPSLVKVRTFLTFWVYRA